MQAALRKLGALDTNERVHRFVAQLQHQKDHQLQHDVDCICSNCERQQLLGARRSRRSVATSVMSAAHGATARLRSSEKALRTQRKAMLYRRHPTNENARRGESKLGRAANLRPGRITLWSVPKTGSPMLVETRHFHPNLPGPLPCATPPIDHHHHKGQKNSPCLCSTNKDDDWFSEEHSVHSNMVHHKFKRFRKEDRPHVDEIVQANSPLPCELSSLQDPAGFLLDDFYSRNPAALANGWLALPHHRDHPTVQEGSATSPAIRTVVRSLLRPNQPQLLGLLPNLKPRYKPKEQASCPTR